jgi:hypothetical protein
LGERPRSGRPPTMPGARALPRQRLGAADPRQHGTRHAQGSCWALAPGLARQTGVPLGRDCGRGVVKKLRAASLAPRADGRPPRLPAPPRRAAVRCFGSLQTQPASGVLPCPARASPSTPAAPEAAPTRGVRQPPRVGAVSFLESPHQGGTQRPRCGPRGHLPGLLAHWAARCGPGAASRPPASEGDLQQNGPSGGDGRRAQREPSGAAACYGPCACPQPMTLPWLPGPVGPPPAPARRLRAGAGRTSAEPDGVGPLCLRSPSALGRCSWRIQSAPCMRSTGSQFRLELRGLCFRTSGHSSLRPANAAADVHPS